MDNNRQTGFKTFIISLLTSLAVTVLALIFSFGYTRSSQPQVPIDQVKGQIPQPKVISQNETNNALDQNNSLLKEPNNANSSSYVAAEVAKKSIPGVVGITSYSKSMGNAAQTTNVGTGVIATGDGYIVTNQHVVGEPDQRLVVSFSDGRNVEGKTLWCDPVLDLAIVKVNAGGLVALPLGKASEIQVGETAIAIGNPLGLQFERTVTQGIVSALNRTIKIDTHLGANFMEDLIQTDASINPGNSGGPLLNSKGEVIGINTVKVESAEGIGFAIPIDFAKPIIDKYMKTGRFNEPYLGIFAFDKGIMSMYQPEVKLTNGLYVSDVDNVGPAARAGIKKEDIITHVDNNEVTTLMQLKVYLFSKNSGEDMILKIVRGSSTIDVVVKLVDKSSSVGN